MATKYPKELFCVRDLSTGRVFWETDERKYFSDEKAERLIFEGVFQYSHSNENNLQAWQVFFNVEHPKNS